MDSSDFKRGAVDLEEAFFAKENARLLQELREKTEHRERRDLLRQVVRIHDDAFLDRLIALGIGPETAMALRLIPLTFVAWADGSVDAKEREAILGAAREQGVAAEHLAQKLLGDWLETKPHPRLLELWKEYIGHIWNRFSDDEQIEMRKNLLSATEDVASAAGGFLGLGKISSAERAVIDDLMKLVS